ncbi:bifunctional methylenetetrahydrofolate dehydrogenase/methenyltetrahydrofolate cyclohydrolase FolD [Paenibacillus sp.]|uniref:bifunctional methylenetetrahydrofolate dehydrogenase/methenyltetrahydrofolate cyclohydrolase FolD n=1 Tax=Paenibacillus sp. TaxID=58172 RepID=UPI002D5F5022|nr:bifunctional methylenetetrahydrofolate dehydrogenase/methenyltetrahydrofolate cyclohydrolase FolD [Paenibacillus sp.]HZG55377.1 bifunctional methylenetetrahydrofolate dehydrogenase/methenyltetrahydrofolate cyclohydrolase FolD [Paenibacillus sp.]
MTATIIDGKKISSELLDKLREEVRALTEAGAKPGLAVVLVGEDPASQVYVRNKEKACVDLGIYSEVHRLAADTPQDELIGLIRLLNASADVHGILVQKPLPAHIDEKAVIGAIAVEKDVDGFHPISVGNLLIGDDGFLPCTPAGVIEMLRATNLSVDGKRVAVIGRSNIVGKPMAALLIRENATVTVCHSRTANLPEVTREADVIVAAIGKPKFVTADFVKPGAVVIDVGVNRLEDGKLAGDVDFDAVKEVASAITPVPGGVGRMTIAMLMKNTVEAARKAAAVSAR